MDNPLICELHIRSTAVLAISFEAPITSPLTVPNFVPPIYDMIMATETPMKRLKRLKTLSG